MKLDYELVRDVMLTIEGLKPNEFLYNGSFYKYSLLKNRSDAEIYYTLNRLKEAKFIPDDAINKFSFRGLSGTSYRIDSLTWEGNHFLNHIRNKSILEKARSMVSNLDELPLSAVYELLQTIFQSTAGL